MEYLKQWKVLPRRADNLIELLLLNRGISTKKQKKDFFNPKISNYEEELEIPGIKKAFKRIKEAVEKNELIIVYGDYDVDGICASAIIYKALTSIGAKVLPYIPHREKEGYGLSKTGLESAKKSGAGVVMTVDNGIVAFDQVEYGNSLGLDLIITDHHIPLEKKPKAYAIVHSTKMCGAAVAWCLVQNHIKNDLREELLQFVAVATVCDLIPLVGLGRAFVYEGLKVLNTTQNIGFLELFKQSGIPLGEIGSYEIGHIIGPRLNAIGRLDHAMDALRLLCTKDPAKAKKLAKLLADKNLQRQQLTADGVEEAKSIVNGNLKKIHILQSKNWTPGIIGLIAARICEEYYRPTIAISLGENHSKGSARSVKAVNIVEFIRNCSDILIDVGGHPGAAGFSILNENIKEFKKRLESLAEAIPDTRPFLEIEAEVSAAQLTKLLTKELEKFEPFGLGNPRPILVTKNVGISDLRTVGKGKHLKFKADGIEAIAFGMGEMEKDLQLRQFTDLAYYLEINKFNGNEILQMKIRGIK